MASMPARGMNKLDVKLAIQTQEEKVMVTDEAAAALSVDPAANAGAIAIQGKDLDALSDDPERDSSRICRRSQGRRRGQMVAKYTSMASQAGNCRRKQSIGEIRINQNPFSSEYDKLGYGRVEILTKPGMDQWHGQLNMSGTTAALQLAQPVGKFAGWRTAARI